MRENATGREAARLGDKTDHGGVIIEAAPDLKHKSRNVALNGHLTECPKCGGTYPIIALGSQAHHGVKIARIGDKTTCGATITGN